MLKFTACDAATQFSAPEAAQVLRGITRGIEKECLRVDPGTRLAQTPHPAGLGSKLTHPWITTDYSEALLEFITPPSQDRDFALPFLRDLHRFTATQLGDEVMWASSMPCRLGEDKDVPLANYGSSNTARIKYVYREGLGHRYGRKMQTIAGVHYNWSLPEAFWQKLYDCCQANGELQDFISERYFGLIRNFLRYSWLIPYLFGASPALNTSFLRGQKPDLEAIGDDTLYGPYATCLRMSDLGYQNRAQSNLNVNFNSLAEYAQALDAAVHTPDPYYQDIGVRVNNNDGKGEHWKQLSANVLQIENEFYAGIRPKRIGLQGERPAVALQKYGVEYLEVRLFDLNPLIDIGITPEQSDFCDAFLMMCLLRDSPPITSREQGENLENKRRVVNRGRHPDLHLLVHNAEQPMRPMAHELFDDMAPFAAILDAGYGGTRYAHTLAQLRLRIDQPELTPSAVVLEGVRKHGGLVPFTQHLSQQHKSRLLAEPLDAAVQTRFNDAARRSLDAQAQIEASPQIPFEAYVAQYFS
jgi:glutamate--cysteine ligase